MRVYTEKDIVEKNGHIYTSDLKYYLTSGGVGGGLHVMSYWYPVTSVDGGKFTLDGYLGNYSYDYTWQGDIPHAVEVLNRVLNHV